ncbi:MAG: hypothetical protein ACE37F_10450 [Nannocystaceae bacterium]|nr:hypothetical protein [bacterium]
MRGDALRFACAMGVLLVGGCAKNAPRSEATMAPAAADAYAGDGAAEDASAPQRERHYASDLEGLQAEFDQLDADLASEGVVDGAPLGASTTTSAGASKADATGRCERICDLKVAICDVAERICGLAEAHEGEAKYAEACTRAESRCEQASDACDACE